MTDFVAEDDKVFIVRPVLAPRPFLSATSTWMSFHYYPPPTPRATSALFLNFRTFWCLWFSLAGNHRGHFCKVAFTPGNNSIWKKTTREDNTSQFSFAEVVWELERCSVLSHNKPSATANPGKRWQVLRTRRWWSFQWIMTSRQCPASIVCRARRRREDRQMRKIKKWEKKQNMMECATEEDEQGLAIAFKSVKT